MATEKISKYDLFYKTSYREVKDLDGSTYDLFISAFTEEKMVKDVFDNLSATKKIWIILPDYKFSSDKLNAINQLESFSLDINLDSVELESVFIQSFFEKYNYFESYKNKKICIDITGFVKPYMIYLIYFFKNYDFLELDIIYSEPKSYQNQDETKFSEAEVLDVRSINGFDFSFDKGKDDLFLINAGYDHKLIRSIPSFNKLVKNIKILLGFPSLQPIMYQENILNLHKAFDELGIREDEFDPLFAPANDPFETARSINVFISGYIKKHEVKNIYLAPLATKAQALGMLLFFFYEKEKFDEKNINIQLIYPFTGGYSPTSGEELFSINLYSLDFR